METRIYMQILNECRKGSTTKSYSENTRQTSDWFLDSVIIAPSGPRFWRKALLLVCAFHKEAFAAMFQVKAESLTENLQKIDHVLLSNL